MNAWYRNSSSLNPIQTGILLLKKLDRKIMNQLESIKKSQIVEKLTCAFERWSFDQKKTKTKQMNHSSAVNAVIKCDRIANQSIISYTMEFILL